MTSAQYWKPVLEKFVFYCSLHVKQLDRMFVIGIMSIIGESNDFLSPFIFTTATCDIFSGSRSRSLLSDLALP